MHSSLLSPEMASKASTGALKQEQAEGPWTESVPRERRTSAWLEATASDLYEAARVWKSSFATDLEDIKEHLMEPDEVAVLSDRNKVCGFVGTSKPMDMGKTGLTARYISGAIMHPHLGGKGKFSRLMQHFPRAAIELLHTQSPCMAKALAKRSGGIFPNAAGQRLGDSLLADVTELLCASGRQAEFCPITGVAPHFYRRCLYGTWPIPGEPYQGGFRYLLGDNTSAIVVVGFANAELAGRYLVPSAIPEVQQ